MFNVLSTIILGTLCSIYTASYPILLHRTKLKMKRPGWGFDNYIKWRYWNDENEYILYTLPVLWLAQPRLPWLPATHPATFLALALTLSLFRKVALFPDIHHFAHRYFGWRAKQNLYDSRNATATWHLPFYRESGTITRKPQPVEQLPFIHSHSFSTEIPQFVFEIPAGHMKLSRLLRRQENRKYRLKRRVFRQAYKHMEAGGPRNDHPCWFAQYGREWLVLKEHYKQKQKSEGIHVYKPLVITKPPVTQIRFKMP
jgi:hypothetical protein